MANQVSLGRALWRIRALLHRGIEDSIGRGSRWHCGSLALLAFFAAATLASATVLVVPGSFQPAVVADEDGVPYWDNFSGDGPGKNVGFNFPLEYLANPDGSFVLSFSLVADMPLMATLMSRSSDFMDELGWYPIGEPGKQYRLFDAASVPGDTAFFNPGTPFGVWLKNRFGVVIYGQGHLNGFPHQYYAVFRVQDGIIVAAEDLLRWQTGKEGPGDYNDMVVSFLPVPEPATLLPVGLALLFFGARSRFFRRRLS